MITNMLFSLPIFDWNGIPWNLNVMKSFWEYLVRSNQTAWGPGTIGGESFKKFVTKGGKSDNPGFCGEIILNNLFLWSETH